MKKKIFVFILSSLIMNVSGAAFYITFEEIERWKSIIIYLITLISFMVIVYITLRLLENRLKKRTLYVVFYLILLSNVIIACLFFG